MVLTDKCYEEMLKEIGFRGYLRQDTICPNRTPKLFGRLRVMGEEHVYPAKGYLRQILNGIDCCDKDLAYLEQLLAETIQNSFEWGHKRNGSLPISVQVANGKQGNVIRISDCGNGHDYKSGTYHRGGTATKLMNLTDIEVAMEGNGNILNFMVMNRH